MNRTHIRATLVAALFSCFPGCSVTSDQQERFDACMRGYANQINDGNREYYRQVCINTVRNQTARSPQGFLPWSNLPSSAQ